MSVLQTKLFHGTQSEVKIKISQKMPFFIVHSIELSNITSRPSCK